MKKKEIKEMSNFELLDVFQVKVQDTTLAKPTKREYTELCWMIQELGQRLGLDKKQVKELLKNSTIYTNIED